MENEYYYQFKIDKNGEYYTGAGFFDYKSNSLNHQKNIEAIKEFITCLNQTKSSKHVTLSLNLPVCNLDNRAKNHPDYKDITAFMTYDNYIIEEGVNYPYIWVKNEDGGEYFAIFIDGDFRMCNSGDFGI